MAFDWYPFYAQRYRKKTLHLTLEQDGCYRRLIDEYMLTEGPLPDNDLALARIIGIPVEQWQALAPVIRPFFEASNGKLVHDTCEEQLHAQAMLKHSKSIKGRAAADARWSKHRELNNKYADAMPVQSVGIALEIPNDATRQDKTILTSGRGSLACAPVKGAQRSPDKIPVSAELIGRIASKGRRFET